MSISSGPAYASCTSFFFSVLEPESAPHPRPSCCLGSSSPSPHRTPCPCPFACNVACLCMGFALRLSEHVFPHIWALLRFVCAGLCLPWACSPQGIATRSSSKPCVVGVGPLQPPVWSLIRTLFALPSAACDFVLDNTLISSLAASFPDCSNCFF